jgi:FAD/FMN-containing dehydrogenase
MTDLKEYRLRQLAETQEVSFPGDPRYGATTAIWSKPIHRLPQAVVHAHSAAEVQSAVRLAREYDLPLSVRGGGHDWAGRALCDGLVIDLRSMNQVAFLEQSGTMRIGGGTRATEVAAVADPLARVVAAGQVGVVGMGGLTTGGGYGSLIGRCGLVADNLVSAEVVLADGRIVTADREHEPELFWALRGGGGNFGVVTSMEHRAHDLPSVGSGVVLYPFAEAKAVLDRCAAIAATAADELTVQVGIAFGADGAPVVMVTPTWCGRPEETEAQLRPFLKLGTVLSGGLEAMPFGRSQTFFDPFLVNGNHAIMETCWIPALEGAAIEPFIAAAANAPTPGCAIFTHEFRGAASCVPETATAFGLRRDHVVIEILATFPDLGSQTDYERHSRWARSARRGFAGVALAGGYANLLAADDKRAIDSYGPNAARLMEAKRKYDPDNLFRSAIPLPAGT